MTASIITRRPLIPVLPGPAASCWRLFRRLAVRTSTSSIFGGHVLGHFYIWCSCCIGPWNLGLPLPSRWPGGRPWCSPTPLRNEIQTRAPVSSSRTAATRPDVRLVTLCRPASSPCVLVPGPGSSPRPLASPRGLRPGGPMNKLAASPSASTADTRARSASSPSDTARHFCNDEAALPTVPASGFAVRALCGPCKPSAWTVGAGESAA